MRASIVTRAVFAINFQLVVVIVSFAETANSSRIIIDIVICLAIIVLGES